MKVVEFEGANGALDSEKGEKFPIYFNKDAELVVTCWELDDKDILELVKNRKIYLCTKLVGDDKHLQPTLLTVETPLQ